MHLARPAYPARPRAPPAMNTKSLDYHNFIIVFIKFVVIKYF